MRIIFFNIWSGLAGDKLINWITNRAVNTDIFCLLEVPTRFYKNLKSNLPNFKSVFETGDIVTDTGELTGQTLFCNNKIQIEASQKIILHKLAINNIGFLLKVLLKAGSKNLSIGLVHGTSLPGNKLDTNVRLKQSKIVIDSFRDTSTPTIIGGDFNLLRNTKSIQLFSDSGYLDLIEMYEIKSTRNKIAWERFKNETNFKKQHDSDYCFTSKEIGVKSFNVPNLEISHHEPLILDFELK